jgi:hypothetical protein
MIDESQTLVMITSPITPYSKTDGDLCIPNAWRRGCPVRILPFFCPLAGSPVADDYKS